MVLEVSVLWKTPRHCIQLLIDYNEDMADDLKQPEEKVEVEGTVRLVDLWKQLADLEKRVAVLENKAR